MPRIYSQAVRVDLSYFLQDLLLAISYLNTAVSSCKHANKLPQNALHQFPPQVSSVLFVHRRLRHSCTSALPPATADGCKRSGPPVTSGNQITGLPWNLFLSPIWFPAPSEIKPPSTITKLMGHPEIKLCFETKHAWLPPASRTTNKLYYSTGEEQTKCNAYLRWHFYLLR